MKDSRVAIFRQTLEGLIESLDATVRVGRWTETETVPGPLKESASSLVKRLGAAGRLASSRFSGSVADAARVKAIVDAMRRLDVAYVAYCQGRGGSPREQDLAAVALDAEISEARGAV
jgi:hypothetical protein